MGHIIVSIFLLMFICFATLYLFCILMDGIFLRLGNSKYNMYVICLYRYHSTYYTVFNYLYDLIATKFKKPKYAIGLNVVRIESNGSVVTQMLICDYMYIRSEKCIYYINLHELFVSEKNVVLIKDQAYRKYQINNIL